MTFLTEVSCYSQLVIWWFVNIDNDISKWSKLLTVVIWWVMSNNNAIFQPRNLLLTVIIRLYINNVNELFNVRCRESVEKCAHVWFSTNSVKSQEVVSRFYKVVTESLLLVETGLEKGFINYGIYGKMCRKYQRCEINACNLSLPDFEQKWSYVDAVSMWLGNNLLLAMVIFFLNEGEKLVLHYFTHGSKEPQQN